MEKLTFGSGLYGVLVIGGIVLLVIVLHGLVCFGSYVWNRIMSGASTMATPPTAQMPRRIPERPAGFDSLARPTSLYDRVPPLYQLQILEGGTAQLIAYYHQGGAWKVRSVKEIDAAMTGRLELLIAEAVQTAPRQLLQLPAQTGKSYEGRYQL